MQERECRPLVTEGIEGSCRNAKEAAICLAIWNNGSYQFPLAHKLTTLCLSTLRKKLESLAPTTSKKSRASSLRSKLISLWTMRNACILSLFKQRAGFKIVSKTFPQRRNKNATVCKHNVGFNQTLVSAWSALKHPQTQVVHGAAGG